MGRYEVSGEEVEDVLAVMKEANRMRLREQQPWRAGLFYLLCLASIAAIFLTVAHQIDAWLVPPVLIASLIGVVVLGALQQRQDGRITERGLLSLLSAALRTARSLGGNAPD